MSNKQLLYDYINTLPEERREAMTQLHNIVKQSLSTQFEESISSNMIHFVIPHSYYPRGYHCDPKKPLPFISLASQKQHISFHFFGLLLFPEVFTWFQNEHANRYIDKLNIGKGCIRFRNPKKIPFDLIGLLCETISVEDFITRYETFRKESNR